MKTLIILSAILLALSSCSKDMPVPCPDPDQTYYPDPYDDPEPDPAPEPDDPDDPYDPGSDDPFQCGQKNHPVIMVAPVTATSLHPIG
ncbi:hypothetical protein [Puia sp.]|jgi:hypothetical protein|uniref:hypothetical protein n=1 Tax=Puia sp. TaxID=2045100 RepID=UPI002F41BA90